MGLVVQKEDLSKMGKKKGLLLAGFLVSLIIALLFSNPLEAVAGVCYGQVVGIEFSILQVRGENGKVSVFWCGYKTSVDSRPPLIGDKVKVEYVKDFLQRNAVTRIAVVR